MPQLSWTHWYGLVAVKGFIIPAFLLAPAINFPCMDIVLSDTLLSPILALPQHCKYIHSAGAKRACPRVTLNPRVGGLIPIIFPCTLLLWHCHSIVLRHCGQGCLLWPFFYHLLFIRGVKAEEYLDPHQSFIHSLLSNIYVKWNSSSWSLITKLASMIEIMYSTD